MSTPVLVPYVPDTTRLGQLIQLRSATQADLARQLAAIQAQAIQSIASTAAKVPSQIVDIRRQQALERQQAEERARQQAREALEQQLREAQLRQTETQIRTAEENLAQQRVQREQQAAERAREERYRGVVNGLLPLAIQVNPDGTGVVNPTLVLQELSAAGFGDRVEPVVRTLTQLNSTFEQARKAQADALREASVVALKHGGTRDALTSMVQTLVGVGLVPEALGQRIVGSVRDDEQARQVLEFYAGTQWPKERREEAEQVLRQKHYELSAAEAARRAEEAQARHVTPESLAGAVESYLMTGQIPPLARSPQVQVAFWEGVSQALSRPDAPIPAYNRAILQSTVSALTNITRQMTTLRAFEEKVQQDMDQLLALSKQILDSGMPILNRPLREVSRRFGGHRAMAQFTALLTEVRAELARLLTTATAGATPVPVHMQKEMQKLLSDDMTIPQLSDVIQNVFKVATKRRIDEMIKQQSKVQQGLIEHLTSAKRLEPPKVAAPEPGIVVERDESGRLVIRKR